MTPTGIKPTLTTMPLCAPSWTMNYIQNTGKIA